MKSTVLMFQLCSVSAFHDVYVPQNTTDAEISTTVRGRVELRCACVYIEKLAVDHPTDSITDSRAPLPLRDIMATFPAQLINVGFF